MRQKLFNPPFFVSLCGSIVLLFGLKLLSLMVNISQGRPEALLTYQTYFINDLITSIAMPLFFAMSYFKISKKLVSLLQGAFGIMVLVFSQFLIVYFLLFIATFILKLGCIGTFLRVDQSGCAPCFSDWYYALYLLPEFIGLSALSAMVSIVAPLMYFKKMARSLFDTKRLFTLFLWQSALLVSFSSIINVSVVLLGEAFKSLISLIPLLIVVIGLGFFVFHYIYGFSGNRLVYFTFPVILLTGGLANIAYKLPLFKTTMPYFCELFNVSPSLSTSGALEQTIFTTLAITGFALLIAVYFFTVIEKRLMQLLSRAFRQDFHTME